MGNSTTQFERGCSRLSHSTRCASHTWMETLKNATRTSAICRFCFILWKSCVTYYLAFLKRLWNVLNSNTNEKISIANWQKRYWSILWWQKIQVIENHCVISESSSLTYNSFCWNTSHIRDCTCEHVESPVCLSRIYLHHSVLVLSLCHTYSNNKTIYHQR